MKKIKFIYNPFSGGGKILNFLDEIFKIYQEYGYHVEVFRISYSSNFNQILEGIGECDHLLICGGDGTINQIVNLLKKDDIDIPIGILPLGTANDFARHLALPSDVSKACKKIIESKPVPFDLGKVNDTYFINIASAGIFTDVSQGTDFNLKKIMGKYAYYIKGIAEFSKRNRYQMTIKSEGIEINNNILGVFVFNGKSAGSLNLAYKSSLRDGLLDVVVIDPENFLEAFDIIQNILKGTHLDREVQGLTYFKTSHLEIRGENFFTDLDGERGPEGPLSINCIKDGIQILGID